ncbi:YybH family protein [Paenisporosarcina cavernae]|uniref:DUF4440 domain-containing protein n=1 Tax=Paenisporosarcina cavernae TaxID=2320858 RepID=A0A385YXD1_9BACL|nr:nuclear transport factor 2 family protein [Paenisporosarcina cavernae]AYC30567.1 DUF4440 domain-containing protein [Paenisporosarcina cavernae]
MPNFSTVQEVLENYKAAAEAQDVEQFLTNYNEDIHLFDCWGSWECKGKENWRSSVTAWFSDLENEGVDLRVSFTDSKIDEGTDVAFARCNVTFAGHKRLDGSKLREMTNRFTFGFRKIENEWKIVHEHSSLPIDLETFKGMMKST